MKTNKYIDHKFTDEIVCPYCGYEYGDSWEFDDDVELDCDECGKTFDATREFEITYSTTKKEK